jgi:hypothetical protein
MSIREIIQEQGVIFGKDFIITGRGERLSIANKSRRGVGVLGERMGIKD